MPPKSALLAVAALSAALAGFVAGAATRGFGLFPPDESPAAPKASTAPFFLPNDPAIKAASLRASSDPADGEVARLRRENEALAKDVADTRKALADALAASAANGAGTSGKGPTFTFGEMGSLSAVREADWREMSEASKTICAALLDVLRKTEAGEPVPKATYFSLQENTERMRKYEYRTIDKIPTAAKHNGELTHPLSVANLIAGVLAQEGKPLSASQADEVERLGAAFDRDFVALRTTWVAGVPRAKRMLEEYRLKGRFTGGLWSALTAEQRALWIDPAFRGLAGLDLYDPTLMILHTTVVVTGETAADLRPKLLALVRKSVGLAADAPSAVLDRAADAFLARLAASLEPVSKSRAAKYSFAQGLAAGEATVELVESLLRDVELTQAARDALLDDFTWYIPRLVKAS